MTDERQGPPAFRNYPSEIAERTAARQEERRRAGPVFPNLAEASLSYSPTKDGPRTLAEVGEEQRRDGPARALDEQHRLSEGTVAGLQALHETAKAAQPKAAPPLQKPAAGVAPAEDLEPDDDAVDEEFGEALKNVQRDVIQNERERKAVEGRVAPIDLASGLLTGEFTQKVPIVEGKLIVRFRCLSTGENNALKLFLVEEVKASPAQARLANELLGFYQMVASVLSINDTSFPAHMTPGDTTQQLVFQPEIFRQKLQRFMNFPMPLTSSLGTHASWFEQRVRALFATTEPLKNG